jgi:D-alanyl-D-alanine carboxypeptidase (penicillin-binding protein 5/6)
MATLACAAVVVLPMAPAAAATVEGAPKATPSLLPPTKAWILVDVDTGEVVAGSNDRTPLPPASLTKVITALAAANVAPTAPVRVGAAAAAAPADTIGLLAGQVWTADELFHALLISSANDAAIALAVHVGGSLSGFQADLAATASKLGLADHPTLMDPAGLDGSEGVDGGNRVSARDLAIAGRALLANPYLASIVAEKTYDFQGPGNIAHRLLSHDLSFLSSYPGAVGIKTGFTDRAGTCLMAAARRNGRTMLAVVLHSANPTTAASTLLTAGFATPVATESTADRLPGAPLAAGSQATAGATPGSAPAASVPAATPATPPATGTRAGPAGATSGAPSGDPLGISASPPAASDVAVLGSHTAPKSFSMLTVDGMVAFLLCLATLARTRHDERRQTSRAERAE